MGEHEQLRKPGR